MVKSNFRKVTRYLFEEKLPHINFRQDSGGGFDTDRDGHHDGGVVGQGGRSQLSANALTG